MLVVTQLMSWAAAPLHLCISRSGSVCVELGDENCTCCDDTKYEQPVSRSPACCANCDAEESDEQPVLAWINPCDCTHIPLMIEQDDSIRASVVSYMSSWDAPIPWLHAHLDVVPRTITALVLQWDRRNDPSRHPVALATIVLRC